MATTQRWSLGGMRRSVLSSLCVHCDEEPEEGLRCLVFGWRCVQPAPQLLGRVPCRACRIRPSCIPLGSTPTPGHPPAPSCQQAVLWQGLMVAEFLKLYADACEARPMGLQVRLPPLLTVVTWIGMQCFVLG